MTIYTFEKVTDLLTELNLDSYFVSKREYYFKKLHPALHKEVYDFTTFLTNTKFTERLYCFTNGITERPKCKNCGAEVIFSSPNKQYNIFCHAGCSVKYYTKNKNSGGTGVVTENTPAAHTGYKQKKLINLVENLGLEPLNLTKDEYYAIVRRVTDWSYTTNIDLIDPDRTRSNEFHIDHMVSVCYGYQNNIQPYIIGDITNLRMLDRSSNSKKYCGNAITIYELIDLYNARYGTNETSPLVETIAIPDRQPANDGSLKMTYYDEEAGVCHVCGGEAHYIRKDDGTHQCTPQKKHCPVMKKIYNKQRNINHKLAQARKQQPTSE